MAKILSITPYKFMPPINGGNWAIYIVDKIFSFNNEVHTLGVDTNKETPDLPFLPHFILPGNSRARYIPFSQYGKTLKLARTLRPDYIFMHHHYLYPMAKKIARKLGIPLYIRSQNIESERFKSMNKWWWPLMRVFEKTAYRGADRVFFITEEDRHWAIEYYGLKKAKAVVLPFAIDLNGVPNMPPGTRHKVAGHFGFDPSVPWLFYMGQMDYKPNEDGLKHILRDILPLLKQTLPAFHILICGRNLSEALQEEIKTASQAKEISYLGFVPDLNEIMEACDIMLNPVMAGGGIKTKVVESLAWNKTVISTKSGAMGIEPSVCGEKLVIVPDNDWNIFTQAIKKSLDQPAAKIPQAYFDFYYSGNIARNMQLYFS